MIIESLKYGFRQLWQFKRIWTLLYSLTLLLAIFVAYPFKNYLESQLGNSLMIGDMIKGVNYTFYADFMNHYGDGISPIMNQSFYVILLYLLLFIFLMGGIIQTFLKRDGYNRSIFWANNADYFFRILRLSIYFLFIHGIVLGIFLFFTYFTIIQNGDISKLESEGIIFVALKIISPIYIAVASLFFMWHDYAKVSLVKNNFKWIFQSVIDSLKFIFKNFRKTFGLYLLNMLILGGVFILNYYISTSFEISGFSTILLSFLLTQIFVITRLGLKMVNLSSIAHMYSPPEKSSY